MSSHMYIYIFIDNQQHYVSFSCNYILPKAKDHILGQNIYIYIIILSTTSYTVVLL